MAADHFQQLLGSLLSTDNEVRQQAEVCKKYIFILKANKFDDRTLCIIFWNINEGVYCNRVMVYVFFALLYIPLQQIIGIWFSKCCGGFLL